MESLFLVNFHVLSHSKRDNCSQQECNFSNFFNQNVELLTTKEVCKVGDKNRCT